MFLKSPTIVSQNFTLAKFYDTILLGKFIIKKRVLPETLKLLVRYERETSRMKQPAKKNATASTVPTPTATIALVLAAAIITVIAAKSNSTTPIRPNRTTNAQSAQNSVTFLIMVITISFSVRPA